MKILLAVDGSEASDAAIAAVKNMPLPRPSVIRVLAATGSVFPAVEGVAVNYGRIMDELSRESQAVANRAIHELEGVAASVEGRVRREDARSAILDEATSWGADLIVVGSHGRRGLRRLMMGSVAEYVVRHAPCSVEVARERHAHAAQTHVHA
jgi:nucleotide-binding universal stress UspA family protein